MERNLKCIFGEQLRQVRSMANLPRADLAYRCGWQGQAGLRRIAQYEQAQRLPNLEDLCRIADALRCTTDRLLGRSG
mgnify:CR=1 FL=1